MSFCSSSRGIIVWMAFWAESSDVRIDNSVHSPLLNVWYYCAISTQTGVLTRYGSLCCRWCICISVCICQRVLCCSLEIMLTTVISLWYKFVNLMCVTVHITKPSVCIVLHTGSVTIIATRLANVEHQFYMHASSWMLRHSTRNWLIGIAVSVAVRLAVKRSRVWLPPYHWQSLDQFTHRTIEVKLQTPP